MSKKKFYMLKVAAFLLVIAPFTIGNSRSQLAWVGEPKLPAKYNRSKKDT